MVLESVFGAAAEKGVSLDKFPSPPTTREMLEDIDAINQDDPILAFTRVLLHKGSGEIVDPNPTSTNSTVLPPPVRDILQNEEFNCDWLIESLAVATVRDVSPKPKSPISSPMNKTASSIVPPTTVDESNPHTKLKQFSGICTKSEELLTAVEERLREMESECHRIGYTSKTDVK